MHDHPRRLVQRWIVILVDDGKREGFRQRHRIDRLRDVDADLLSDLHRVVGLRVLATDLDLAILDETLDLGARLVRQHRGEEAVETDALALFRDGQRHAALFRAVFGAGAPARAR